MGDAMQEAEQFFFDLYMPKGRQPDAADSTNASTSDLSLESEARGAKSARMAANGNSGDKGGQGKGRNGNGDRKRGAQPWTNRGGNQGDHRQWDRRGWSDYDRSDSDIQHALHSLQKLVLRHEDTINALRLDHSFVIFLRTHGHCSVVQPLNKAQQEWRRLKSSDPSKLTRPMRTTLLLCLFHELNARLENIKDAAHQDARDQLQTMKWLIPTDNMENPTWAYLKWNGERQRPEPEHEHSGLPYVQAVATVQAIMKLVAIEGAVVTFHPKRPLTPQMSGETLTCELQVGTRSKEAAALHEYLTLLSNSAATQLIGATIRPERLQRSAAAQIVSKQLG